MKITNLKLAIVFAAVALFCIIWIIIANYSSNIQAEIYSDGELIRKVSDLDRDDLTSFTVKTQWGENVIEYGKGEICVKSSDCENQTCVNYGKISAVGQSIICAPHRLVVKLTGSSEDRADAVT